MASKKITGITVEIGGDTTKLGKALAESEKSTWSLQNELKNVEKLLKMDPGNIELLNQKQQILTSTIEETTQKLNKLKDAEEQVIQQFNRGDIGADQLRAFQQEIIKTEQDLNGFEQALKDTNDDLENVGNKSKDSGEGFSVMKGALADLVANGISTAISAIGDFIGSLFELSEATEEYRTMQAKLEGSTQTFGYELDFTKSKYEEFYKYLGDDQMATNAITNLMGLGTSTESLTSIANGAIGVWASYGDSIPIESLTESINETVNAGKVTGTFADTINWCKDANEQLNGALDGNKEAQKAYQSAIEEGLPVEDAFNEALATITDTQERADVVAQFLNSTYGESKTRYDELNESVLNANESELALKDTQAELGEVMSPVNDEINRLKTEALEAITPIVKDLAQGFLDLVNYMRDHKEVAQGVTSVVIALAVAFGTLALALGIEALINGVTAAIAFLNTTLLANPIVLVIAAITALVASFLYLWENCEDFRIFWTEVWQAIVDWVTDVIENIKSKFEEVASFISEKWTEAWNFIQEQLSTWGDFFLDIWEGVKSVFSDVGSWFGEKFTEAWENIKGVFASWGEFFGGLWDTIKDKFSELGTKISESIGESVKSGINAVISAIENTINNGIRLINSAIDIINTMPGVAISKIKLLEFPRLAMGGVVDKATFAEIGEDGAEAVVPLEKNLGWLDQLASRLNDRLSDSNENMAILARLESIYDRLDRMQIVLDTGTLVGETIDKIDAGLADRQILNARGV